MNRKEILESAEIVDGAKRKGSHGKIRNIGLKKPAQDKIDQDIAVFLANNGEIEQCASHDEFSSTKAAAVFSQN